MPAAESDGYGTDVMARWSLSSGPSCHPPVLPADLPVPGGPQLGLSDGAVHQDPQDRLGRRQSSAEEFVGRQ